MLQEIWAFGLIYPQTRCINRKLLKKQTMNRKKIAYILIFASCILLVFNLLQLDFDNLKAKNFLGIGPNIFVIVAMLFTIRGINKREKK